MFEDKTNYMKLYPIKKKKKKKLLGKMDMKITGTRRSKNIPSYHTIIVLWGVIH